MGRVKPISQREYSIGDVVHWKGHLTGLTSITVLFGIVVGTEEGAIEIEMPAILKGGDGKPELTTIKRKYSRELFGRLSPKVLHKAA